MPAFFSIGAFKNDQVTNGGALNIGQNIVQNRNATKQNNGSFHIGDGINNLPIVYHLNVDPDVPDMTNNDFNNFGGSQV